MSDPVVFDNVWKKFRRGERHDSLRDLVPALAKRAFRRGPNVELEGEEFWAVKDVSFSVPVGEALGIIGPNGAGKSTTLKLLTKILKPTRGTCRVQGRVGALIEVAAGFHPDLTGRENIFLQGAIMGMKRPEISRKLDDIIDFAGVSEFLDTPVKRYSSGMNARLGFAIAAHLDPDVLLVDEVLSVGDITFQQRCVERMHDFKRNGVVIVFVSHNLQAVADLCERALLLHGTALSLGKSSQVIEEYVRTSTPGQSAIRGRFDVTRAQLCDVSNISTTSLRSASPAKLRVWYRSGEPTNDVTLGFMVYRSADNLIVYEGNFRLDELGVDSINAGDEITVDFNFLANLTRGQYHVECYTLHNPTHEYLSRLSPAASFTVQETRTCRGVADLAIVATRVSTTEDRKDRAAEPLSVTN